jgi:hypothetical protein
VFESFQISPKLLCGRASARRGQVVWIDVANGKPQKPATVVADAGRIAVSAEAQRRRDRLLMLALVEPMQVRPARN